MSILSPQTAADLTAAEEIPLREANLAALQGRVDLPGYERSALRPRVVHIGVGGFHRAHQAVYFDRLADLDVTDGWGVTGVGLHSTEIGEVLRAQDGLYTVVERGADGSRARVVGALLRYLHAATERDAVLDALADPGTQLVTLTITGNGYNLDAKGAFAVDDPTVAVELEDPGNPDTVFGYLVEALDRRRRAGVAPFTVLSCDNIPSNGRAAATMVTRFAELRDPALARWVEAEVAFPSSMVDRITPQTTPEERDSIARTFGVDDRWPVICEPFSQWVVEDRFCNGRPALERVGVQFVDDVTPYELTKKRLLNASHCALGYLGHLAGHRTTAEVMADPVFAAFVSGFLDEVIPLLPPVDGLDLGEYKATLLERLANPEIADDLTRLCRRGSVKMPSYLLPSVKEAHAAGRPHPLMTLAVAGWFRYLTAVDYAGEPIDVRGPRTEEFVDLARRDGSDPRPLLGDRAVFDGLGDDPAFVRELHEASEALNPGPREAIKTRLDRPIAATGPSPAQRALEQLRPRVLLCDVDGNLFPSEEPAFDASVDVTNRFLGSRGVGRQYQAQELLGMSTGRNFRTTAVALAEANGVTPPDGPTLDEWVAEETEVVSAHLGRTLRPDPAVLGPLTRLAEHYTLAAVSSSALSRLDTCFRATGLGDLLPSERRFSAEDSLPTPTSKPDPAVYLFAVARLGVDPRECLAIEDSLPGVQSAVAAGCPTVGNTMFVAEEERAARTEALLGAGAVAVITSWSQLADVLLT